MNRKAVFVSLTAALVLVVIVIAIVLRSHESALERAQGSEYARNKYVADYVKDIENIYLPALILTSEKYALRGISEEIGAPMPNLAEELTSAVNTGSISSGAVMSNQHTLPYLMDVTFSTVTAPVEFDSFTFEVTGLEQTNPWTITVNSRVAFGLKLEGITWSNVIDYSTDITVIGLYDYSLPGRVTDKWQEDAASNCVLRLLDSTHACTVSGLVPLT